MRVFRSPVNLAKSWFFLRGSEPAPIICQPIISLSSLYFSGLLKLLIRVVLPNSLCDSEPSLGSSFVILAKLLPLRNDIFLGVSYFSREASLSLEAGLSSMMAGLILRLESLCRRSCCLLFVLFLFYIFGRKPSLLKSAALVNLSPLSNLNLNEVWVCLNLSLREGGWGNTYSNQTSLPFLWIWPIESRSILTIGCLASMMSLIIMNVLVRSAQSHFRWVFWFPLRMQCPPDACLQLDSLFWLEVWARASDVWEAGSVTWERVRWWREKVSFCQIFIRFCNRNCPSCRNWCVARVRTRSASIWRIIARCWSTLRALSFYGGPAKLTKVTPLTLFNCNTHTFKSNQPQTSYYHCSTISQLQNYMFISANFNNLIIEYAVRLL